MQVSELQLLPTLPEIFLALAGMALLLIGVFQGNGSTRQVSWLVVASLAVTAILVLMGGHGGRVVTMRGLFVTDGLAVFAKVFILMGSAIAVIMSHDYLRREDMQRFEFPLLVLFSTLGMIMMVSANDLISLYLSIELQSLALYVVAAFRRDSQSSTEAGLKYFVLGALSSGLLLYGASLIYGSTGTTNFDAIGLALSRADSLPIGVIFGLVFLVAGLAFKVSAVPFHMWTPDVYEGAPTPVTALLALAPKFAAMILLLRVMTAPFGLATQDWQPIIVLISIGSMLLGAFAAINQRNIKRLLAYSSIGHMGYALIGLAAGNEGGMRGVLIYMAIYVFMSAGTFACVLSMRRRGRLVEEITDLSGLSKTHPMMALGLAIFMFSMAGIPPLAGFFGKLYVFLAAIQAGQYTLAVIGVLSSVVGAYYYLRIVKVMYFDEPVDQLDRPIARDLGWVQFGTAAVTLLFFVYPGPLFTYAEAAARALFPS
ncbi:MAG: NADH-quinone oxidoreductase subunit NuoN [Proteobacteria bacterium]|nr:NADH-quinone oxidoreductase subunit NuoN [Pseudomonadota bacterium]MBI3498906.1 NADH-quinone oxidoreductase subunit NuoN [Pseudomonadota bacterium]